MSLLEKALKVRRAKSPERAEATPEKVELAAALVAGLVTQGQAKAAVPSGEGKNLYIWAFSQLRDGIEAGWVRIEYLPPREQP